MWVYDEVYNGVMFNFWYFEWLDFVIFIGFIVVFDWVW